jgi:hypothetical protein
MNKRIKILTVCSHGNIRSVALAYILKTLFGYEAIAIGSQEVSPETYAMLHAWADKILVVDKEVVKPFMDLKKTTILSVGKDQWRDAHAQGLVHKLYKELRKHPELW